MDKMDKIIDLCICAKNDYKRWPDLFDTVAEIYSMSWLSDNCRYKMAVIAEQILSYLEMNNRWRTIARIRKKHNRVIHDMKHYKELREAGLL